MDGLLQDPAHHSQLEMLLSQQRYEESVSLLNSAIERNPGDRDAYLYRLLVARILVLRRLMDARQVEFSMLTELGLVQMQARWVQLLRQATAWVREVSQDWRREIDLNWIRRQAKAPLAKVGAGLNRLPELIPNRLPDVSHIWDQWLLQFRIVRRFAGSMRAVLVASGLSILIIIATLCVIFLRGSSARPLVSPQAPAPSRSVAALSDVVYPTSPSRAELSNERLANLHATAIELNQVEPPAHPGSAVRGSLTAEEAIAEPAAAKRTKTGAAKQPANSKKDAQSQPVAMVKNGAGPAHPKEAGRADRAVKSTMRYSARQPIAIRDAPRFGATPLENVSQGAAVSVVEITGSWAKVLLPGDKTGFVRVEFLNPPTVPQP